MNDDWSTPTGEHLLVTKPAIEDPAPDPPFDLDLVHGTSERRLRLIDAFLHELALEESNDPVPNTPEEWAEDNMLMAWVQRLMAGTQNGES